MYFQVKRQLKAIIMSITAVLAACPFIFPNVTAITGLAMSPAAPNPGQSVNVTWNYTSDYGPEPEKYFIAVSDACALPATGGGNKTAMNVVVGDACAAPTPATNCLSCVASSGCADLPTPTAAGSHPASKTITIPSTLIPGYTYYMNLAMGSYNVYMNPDLTAQQQQCLTFTVPLTAPYIKLNKVAEGTTANVGTKVLFTIYYDAGNVHNFQITDAVDPRFTILQVYSGGTAAGQNITWASFPAYITSPVKGSVSFLAQVNSGTTGTILTNTAVGSASDPASGTSSVNVVIGQPGLTLSKSVSSATANPGDTLTYTIQYNNLGTTMVEYENFDSGTIPSGWTATGTGAVWTAADTTLRQTSSTAVYSYILDNNITPLHDGIYECDMLIPSSNTAHMDGVMHFIQVDGSNFYMARINASDKHLYLDKVVAGTASIGGTSVANPHGINIKQDTWYTVKVQVCGSSIMMKVWPKGDNEYPVWDMSVTDSSISGNGLVGFQSNEGPQQYDNLKVFSLTASTNPRIFDTVPAGINYQGCSGGTGCSKPGSVINWTVGSTCAGALAVSWTGIVNGACGSTITNVAGIDSDDPPPPELSDPVYTTIGGCTPTNTPSATASRTVSPTFTHTPTFTFTQSPGPTNTPSPTRTFTPSLTVTDTVSSNTPTATKTFTNTFTDTPSPTATFTQTNTPTATPTFTATYSPTSTNSQTATPTMTPSLTVTDTVSSNTPTATRTFTDTFTPTQTGTATQTYSSTYTPSFTRTASPTYTDSPVFTATVTGTYTNTFTMTSTYTATRTQTFTATVTLTSTPAAALVSVSMSAVDPAVSAGSPAQVRIDISVSGNYASNVSVWDTIPAEAAFDPSLPENAGWAVNGNVITYSLGTMNSGASASVYFTLTVSSSLASGDSVDLSPATCGYDDIIAPAKRAYSLPASIKIGEIVVYPNPFNPSTAVGNVLKFGNLPKGSIVSIMTLSGENVINFNARTAYVYWDGKNVNGKPVSAGIYYFIIRYNSNQSVYKGKLFVMKSK